ncbi:hypothetical protein ACQPXH_15265 [Nocardia sp. CA-135953]|uniref:hypothetical protein n=1 Tax=Nocardia sp. CA-135953 TaxID=3239978 RepID=UPI003D969A78
MTHGFASVKEWVAPFAEVFGEAGVACLVYDHPGFGTSDGEPRYEVDPVAQADNTFGRVGRAEPGTATASTGASVWPRALRCSRSAARTHGCVVAAPGSTSMRMTPYLLDSRRISASSVRTDSPELGP